MMVLITIAVLSAFHVVLFYALMTRRLNAMYFVAATFCFMAPVSTASLLEHTALFKYGRVYTSVLIVILGVLVYRLYSYGPAAIVFTIMIAFYAAGAFWSDQPLMGFLYKGLFGAVFLSGIMLAQSTRSISDLQHGLRILACGGAAFAIFILMELVRNPDAIAHIGRLYAFGINPNRIGHTSAPLFIVACCVALYDPIKRWRTFGFALMGTLGVIILYTGSRGAAGMAAIGAVAVTLPIIKRPGLFLTITSFIGVVVYVGFGIIEDHARTRLLHIPENIREGMWTVAMNYFREAPVFGQGWVHVGDFRPTTQNMHSIYLQVLAETGIIGSAAFLLAIAFVGVRLLMAWRYVIRIPSTVGYGFFMLGIFAAIFAHGVVESATFVGTTVNAMMLGFAIALIDRLPQMAWEHSEIEALAEDAEYPPELYDEESDRALPAY